MKDKDKPIYIHEVTPDLLPKFLPPGWRDCSRPPQVIYRGPKGLLVLVSLITELDDEQWLHVSASHRKRILTYEELTEIKRIFIGSDRGAIQVFPPARHHVNYHPRCLHLWSCISNPDFLPDFTRGLGIL